MASLPSTNFSQVQKEYDAQAATYNELLKMPFGVLESQLFNSAVARDDFCKNAVVLDLGGGTGLRARQALEAGAAQVDVVDISKEMMAVGERDARTTLGPQESSRISWFLGDVSKPLFGESGVEGLRVSYDLVMANWVFDHVSDPGDLEAIWDNIATALRPGGRFVGVRACDPRSAAMTTGKYGPTCQDFAGIPGGLSYSSTIPASLGPPVHLENASLEVSYSGSTAMHDSHGFYGVEIEPCENAEIVRSDPEFWGLWMEQPGFAVVRARKR